MTPTRSTSQKAAPKQKTASQSAWLQRVGIVVGALVIGTLIGWSSRSSVILRDGTFAANDIATVREMLKQSYDGDIDTSKQAEGAIRGLVASLGDPYTTYMDAAESKDLSDDLKGELSGIGVEVGIKNNRLTIIAPIDGAPASRAGVRAGDIIALIDGKDSSQFTLDEAVKNIRGDKGTTVTLTILRGTEKPREIAIVRDTITVASVTTTIKEGDVGYIRLRRFGDDTELAFRNAAAELASKGVKSVILDLRDNPGGYLDGAVSVSSEFVGSGTIVEERSRHFSDPKTMTANPGGNLTKVKVIVLINQGSASASEIAAGALKDNGRATLVGEKSFGKGSVQEVRKLANGSQLKITVAHWYTPKGVNISKEGIAPDVEVKLTNDDYNANRDPQLDKALELARQ
ncbi:S41 family peptidase [Patescibacteria group bacterium]|nr:MAG: S41 family peptidase [Patescibacteria group bacterium]